jgi:hypothetical protein
VIKLVDFGVAKAAQNVEETAAGSIKGKTSYLSPEQCRGEPVDRRSDIFSMGIVLHEMLTSGRLFRRDSEMATMHAILSGAIPPPSARRPEVSAELDAIVIRALSKDREGRYATAADMLEAIETLAMREQHLLSSTPMTRFLKELLGVRPLPWLELAPTDIGTMTVSPDLEPVAPDPAAVDVPTVGRPDPRPPASNPGPVPSREKEVAALLGGAPMIGPPLAPSHTPASAQNFDFLQAHATTQRSVITLPRVLVLLAVFGLAGAGAAIFLGGKKKPQQTEVVKMDTTLSDAAVARPAVEEPIADAAGIATPENVVDAAVAAPVGKPATIADAVANLDWTTALGRCAAAVKLSPADNGDCGVAACQSKKRDLAISYYRATPAASRGRVERACLAAGIKLKQAGGTRPTTPTQDPCELHPLECHK